MQPDFDDDIVDATCVTDRRRGPPRTDPRAAGGGRPVTGGPLDILVIFVLAAFVGFEVISKVPSILHTPLMSGSNAIHGIILVGAMIVANEAHGALQITPGPAGGDPGHPQHRGWGGRDRPHAGDVQGPRPQRAARRRVRNRPTPPGDRDEGLVD